MVDTTLIAAFGEMGLCGASLFEWINLLIGKSQVHKILFPVKEHDELVAIGCK